MQVNTPDGAQVPPTETSSTDEQERLRTLRELGEWLDGPMAFLGVVWLALLVVEITRGTGRITNELGIAIWIVFVADFVVRLILAPNRTSYLTRNWLTLLSLILPAFRAVRFLRALRVLHMARGASLVRVVASLNRGMTALSRSMRRRGAGYVFGLTLIVTLGGAAGMVAFESFPDGSGIKGFGDAVWYTGMVITTIGSQYWPRTAEGRILTGLLSCYALGIVGYITAALASFFVGRDAASESADISDSARHEALNARAEIAALRHELAALTLELRGRRSD